MDEIEDFKEYLKAKQLGDKTIYTYMNYIKYLPTNITKRTCIIFLNKYKYHSPRAVLKNWIDFKELNITLPRVTGRKRKRLIKILSNEEITSVRKYFYSNPLRVRNGLAFDITYYGGLRRAELLNLKWKDFNFNKWANDKSKPCELNIIGKGDKERIVLIPKEVIENFYRYSELNNPLMDSLIFNIKPTRWFNILKEVSEVIGRHINPHLIRHTVASNWLNKGADIYVIKEFLGHDSIATTEKYLHSDWELIKKKMEKYAVFKGLKDTKTLP